MVYQKLSISIKHFYSVYLVAVRQETTLLYVSYKTPNWNIVQDKFKVVQLLNGLTKLVHLPRKKNKHQQLTDDIF